MSPARADRGSLLIITLALVIIVGALAVAVGRHLALEVRLTRARLVRQRTELLARGGIWTAMMLIREDSAALDWAGDDWALPQAVTPTTGNRLSVTVLDEERKLPLNGATVEQLERVTGSPSLAQVILDAVDPADPAEDQPGAMPPYFAKNAAFNAPEELLDLSDMDDEPYAALCLQTSPYVNAQGPVNLNTATEATLRAVGLTDPAIALIVSFREGPDGAEAHEDDGVFEQAGLAAVETLKNATGTDLTGTEDGNLLISSLFGVSSQTFLIHAEAVSEEPTGTTRIEAVVRRGEGPEAMPVILAWRQS